MGLLAASAFAAVWYGLVRYCNPQRISPDGNYYIKMARRERVPVPFSLRPLLPFLLRERMLAWRIVGAASLVATSLIVYQLAIEHGLDPIRALFASVLFVGLPLFRINTTLPVLVDAPAIALAGASALCAVQGHVLLAVAVALLGAGVKEQAPLFAALAAWSAWPLIALVVPVSLYLFRKHAKADHGNLQHPLAYARGKQAPRLLSLLHQVAPWGVCLAVLWAPFQPAVWASIAVAYALTFTAADSTRVYQWAALPVCVAAAAVVPSGWLVPAAVVHLWNPLQGEI